jgi:hypothetical protein
MVNRSKAKGSLAERLVCEYLIRRGWPAAERRALAGSQDRGDVAGIPGVMLEVKSCKTIDLAGWLAEAKVEQANAGATIGAVVAKKRGTTDPGDWYALLTFRQLCDLLAAAGYRGSAVPRDGDPPPIPNHITVPGRTLADDIARRAEETA